ncbi:MAG: YncE family protein [Candidatus Gastranaerophilales bacterium]|nr:YncE family protein [Candidatus Gastranaerophilales bacterium]
MKKFFKLLLAMILILNVNSAFASVIPSEIETYIKKTFPNATVRFDGLVTLDDGTQYLPVFPVSYDEAENPVQIIMTLPENTGFSKKPDLILFKNSFCLLKIIKKEGEYPTVISSNEIPIKVKLGMLPQDLLVPSGLVIPPDLRIILGDLKIPVKEEKKFRELKNFKHYKDMPKEQEKQVALVKKAPAPKGFEDFANAKFYVANFDTNSIFILDPFVGRPYKSLQLSSIPAGMAITRDNRYILVPEIATNKVSVIDIVSNSIIKEIEVGQIPSGIITSLYANKAFVSDKNSSTISIIDLLKMKKVDTIKTDGKPVKLTLSSDGMYLFYIDAITNDIYRINIAEPFGCELITQEKNVSKILNVDNNLFILNRISKNLRVFDLVQKKDIKEIEVGQKPVDIKFINGKIYVLCAGSDDLRIINAETLEVEKTIALETGGFLSSITALDNQKKAIIANNDSYEFIILDTQNDTIIKKLPVSINIGSLIISKTYSVNE